MSRRYRVFLSVLLFSLPNLTAGPAAAQESIGFAAPEQTSRLRDYRLPAWSYRTWDVNFSLSGGGADRSTAGRPSLYNNTQFRLATDYRRSWESEPLDASLAWGLDGRYARSHSGGATSERHDRDLRGDLDVAGSLRRYLQPEGLYVGGGAGLSPGYDERNAWSRADSVVVESDAYRRDTRLDARLEAGWGRQRNVVPLLRAERLSERLVALGRPPLSDAQIRDVAAVFATEYGYRQVFDRADRHFWADVLAPLLGDGPPLTPFEIFYLRDVLNEDLGARYEGFRAGVAGDWVERSMSTTGPTNKAVARSVEAELAWSHNLSLTRQISLAAAAGYQWSAYPAREEEDALWRVEASHLWNLADRYRWDLDLAYRQNSAVTDERRARGVNCHSAFHVFVEDRMDVVTRVHVAYDWVRSDNVDIGPEPLARAVSDGWSWSYSLAVTYQLDRLFL